MPPGDEAEGQGGSDRAARTKTGLASRRGIAAARPIQSRDWLIASAEHLGIGVDLRPTGGVQRAGRKDQRIIGEVVRGSITSALTPSALSLSAAAFAKWTM